MRASTHVEGSCGASIGRAFPGRCKQRQPQTGAKSHLQTTLKPEYIAYYRNQLRELLAGYENIFTVWFDGVNGGKGFYGGARETRRIDNRTYYDWPVTWQIVRDLMPGAVMFSDAGPDFRWVGNEQGVAGDPCWATLNIARRYPGGSSEGLNSGERPGTAWVPAGCDVSIRPGWFYHAAEDDKVKTPGQLVDIYYHSVGRGACLNPNLPPDHRGRIHERDVESLCGFRAILDATFGRDLAKDAKPSASNTRGSSKRFHPNHVLDHRRDTYWATDDGVTIPELVLDMGQPVTFNVVSLREYLLLGQRIEAFALERWDNGEWLEFAKGRGIGNHRLVRMSKLTTQKVRRRITRAPVCPALSELGLYLEPGERPPAL